MKPSPTSISDAITYTLGAFQGRGWMTDPFLCRDMILRLNEILRLVAYSDGEYWCSKGETLHLQMIHNTLLDHETKTIEKEMGQQ